mmetsp:Transcript_27865/g.57478  ORF Transcript_27865/g.57478 Transcript_27865/m.57478 type:complete len:99 (+) Transcript_27865:118-414(+)
MHSPALHKKLRVERLEAVLELEEFVPPIQTEELLRQQVGMVGHPTFQTSRLLWATMVLHCRGCCNILPNPWKKLLFRLPEESSAGCENHHGHQMSHAI